MLINLRPSSYFMGSNVNLGSFEVTEATVSRSVSRSSFFFFCLGVPGLFVPGFVRGLQHYTKGPGVCKIPKDFHWNWRLRRCSHLSESCPSQHNHDRVQDSVNIQFAFTSAAMYPVSVMFIVTSADRILTTLPDIVQKAQFYYK